MPTYVYECSACNTVFEKEQRITEDALKSCDCGSSGTVRRLIQPVGIAFKGSGFHINDYSGVAAPTDAKQEEGKKEGATPAAPAADCTGSPTTCACSTTPAAPAPETKSSS